VPAFDGGRGGGEGDGGEAWQAPWPPHPLHAGAQGTAFSSLEAGYPGHSKAYVM